MASEKKKSAISYQMPLVGTVYQLAERKYIPVRHMQIQKREPDLTSSKETKLLDLNKFVETTDNFAP